MLTTRIMSKPERSTAALPRAVTSFTSSKRVLLSSVVKLLTALRHDLQVVVLQTFRCTRSHFEEENSVVEGDPRELLGRARHSQAGRIHVGPVDNLEAIEDGAQTFKIGRSHDRIRIARHFPHRAIIDYAAILDRYYVVCVSL